MHSRTLLFIPILLMLGTFIGCSEQQQSSQTETKLASDVIEQDSKEKQLRHNQQETVLLYTIDKDTKTATTSLDEWWDSASFYYIWVRSFFDEDGDGNGDIKGVISKLDYLSSLGIDAIILSPIFQSPSYHGYDVTNFDQVNTDFGTWADLEELIKQAHERNIKVVLDVPINHVSDQHDWFVKALEGERPFVDYFIWSDSPKPGYGKPWSNEPDPESVWHYKLDNLSRYYYGAFDYSQPDLNYRHPEIQKYFQDLLLKLAKSNLDGVRLDAVRYLFESGPQPLQADLKETIEFITEVKQNVKKIHPSFYFLGEVLSDFSVTSLYTKSPGALDQVYDFGTNFIIHDIAQSLSSDTLTHLTEKDALAQLTHHKKSIINRINMRFQYGGSPSDFVTFANSHDFERLTVFEGINLYQQKLSASIMLLMPGAVTLYYGEEIGLTQYGVGDDIYRRAPMQWDKNKNAGFSDAEVTWVDRAEWFPWRQNFTPWWSTAVMSTLESSIDNVAFQTLNKNSILNHYRNLFAMRKTNKEFFKPVSISAQELENKLLILEYGSNMAKMKIAINFSPFDCVEVPDTLMQKTDKCIQPGDFVYYVQ